MVVEASEIEIYVYMYSFFSLQCASVGGPQTRFEVLIQLKNNLCVLLSQGSLSDLCSD